MKGITVDLRGLRGFILSEDTPTVEIATEKAWTREEQIDYCGWRGGIVGVWGFRLECRHFIVGTLCKFHLLKSVDAAFHCALRSRNLPPTL